MELLFSNQDTEEICVDLNAAREFFGGNEVLAMSLLSRVNSLRQADTIHDIRVMPNFHFHNLENIGRKRLKGYFAIDVKSRKEQWRIILEPLDETKKPFVPCNIDIIAKKVRIVEIKEVSKHYG